MYGQNRKESVLHNMWLNNTYKTNRIISPLINGMKKPYNFAMTFKRLIRLSKKVINFVKYL